MSSREITQRIFVVGVPRSGTTLVQGLLAAHSQACSFTESHLFSRHYKSLPWLGTSLLVRSPAKRLIEFIGENKSQSLALPLHDFPALGKASRIGIARHSKVVAKICIETIDALALSRGSQRWIEKTPRHLHHIPFLEKVICNSNPPGKDLRFIHVLRRGIPTVASLYQASKKWERPYGIEECVARWNQDLALSLKRANSERDLFVSYEALTTQTENVLSELLSRLDWAPEQGLLERFESQTGSLVTRDETWKQKSDRPIQPSDSSLEVLTEEQRQWADEHLRHELYEKALEHCIASGKRGASS